LTLPLWCSLISEFLPMFHFSKLVASRQAVAAARLVCAPLGSELLIACDTLGGPPAAERLGRFFDALRDEVLSEVAVRRELNWLRSLLALEFVCDLESEESARFAMLDPASDRVVVLCQLHDIVDELIARLPGNSAPVGARS
jgi:hypothetical protein